MLHRFIATPLALVLAATAAGPLFAQDVNSNALSENGWFSDDTRADGSGILTQGTNLISPTLTAAPEGASPMAMSLFDADILDQIVFGQAPGTVPVATHLGAVQLMIELGAGFGKSQISHRKDDGIGHGPGSGFDASFNAEYSWMGDGTPTVTASLKFGIMTPEFSSITSPSSRTGENVWDKVLIYEPGQGNGAMADGLWQTETIDFTTGQWWFFDRLAGGSSQSQPVTLSAMSTSTSTFSGSKTLGDVYALIINPASIITSVQFGVGSGNAGANVYVNQLETSVYRSGQTTTFGQPSPFDQDVTPEVIFGSGNANGGFTLSRDGGLELGLRSKLRFPAANVYNSNGDGTYTWNAIQGPGASNPLDGVWNFEWTVNTDPDGTLGRKLDELTYELGIDFDASGATDYNAFDNITPTVLVPFFDHAIGDNSTGNGMGTSAIDGLTYDALLANNNVAQNSWRMTFFDLLGTYDYDPTEPGFYEIYLAAFDGVTELARTEITVVAVNGTSMTIEADDCQTDTDPSTAGVQVEVELWMRNPDDLDVTGFQSFLAFDTSKLTYEGALSSYDNTLFDANIQPTVGAEVSAGKLRLDGNAMTAVDGDALLATLVFTAVPATTTAICGTASVDFDPSQPFGNEVSNLGSPLATATLDSVDFLIDAIAPTFGPAPNITQPADAGSCTQAVVFFSAPTATDNCDTSPTVVCVPPSGSVFPVGATIVACTATDDCDNSSTTTFTVTVTATNAVQVTVQLPGSMPTSRCIRFVANVCAAAASDTLVFTGSPATAVATIEISCGVWTDLCAKDEQHTLWDSTTLSIVGPNYVADTTLVLEGGDTDNDGDVDINDVTLLLAQFGDPAVVGGCPWNPLLRDADFSNNNNVGSEDYAFLVANWLTTSACACTGMATRADGSSGPEISVPVRDARTAAADLNGDSRVDVRDVELFEALKGLPNDLSSRMRR